MIKLIAIDMDGTLLSEKKHIDPPQKKAVHKAIEAGVKVAGCTVHFVGTGLDDGPIITQTVVPVYDHDTEETLSSRILEKEHPTYVAAVAAFCADKLTVSGNRVLGMHGEEN